MLFHYVLIFFFNHTSATEIDTYWHTLSLHDALPISPMGRPLLPDSPNWAWHEYGARVGFWRFLDALQSRGLKATLALNGTVCSLYPEMCAAARDAGWEFMGHGYVQLPMHTVQDQTRAIADTIKAILDFTGNAPHVWESPGRTAPEETRELLDEAGIKT